MLSRSELGALNHDSTSAAASLTPHPVVYPGAVSTSPYAGPVSTSPYSGGVSTTPFANRELTVQPALLHQLTIDADLIDVDSRPYYPPHQSNVPIFFSVT